MAYPGRMELLAHTRIVMWEGGSLWIVDATPVTTAEPRRTDPHAHHAIQVTLGLGGQFRLRADGRSVRGDAVAVDADTAHDFEAEGLVALLFIEPESRSGRAVAGRLFASGNLAPIPSTMLGDFRAQIARNLRGPHRDDVALAELGAELADHLAGGVRATEPDSRVRQMIDWAMQQKDGPVSLGDLGAIGGLSADRLRHLFVEQTGLPFRTYLLWLRLTQAVELLARGVALTPAAHEAGFADSAHFSRTFRRMFGIAPTNLRLT